MPGISFASGGDAVSYEYKDRHFPFVLPLIICVVDERCYIVSYGNCTVVIAFSGDSGFCVLCSEGSGEWPGLPCVGVWRGAVRGRHYNHWASI